MKNKRVRKSLSLRLQPYEGTLLAEVTDYLNSLEKEEMHSKVAELLVMALLPYARLHQKLSSEQLRNTFLIARDMHEKHISIVALALRVDSYLVNSIYSKPTLNPIPPKDKDSSRLETEGSKQYQFDEGASLVTGDVSASSIGRLFD